MKKADKKLFIRQLLLGVLFLALMTLLTVKYFEDIKRLIFQEGELRRMIISYGYKGVFVLIGFQILQIVIPFIPGEVVQFAGGYVYGFPLAMLYLLIGTLVGGVTVFYVSRYIGYPIVRIFVSEDKMKKFEFLLKSKKTEVAIFFLFLLPGIPKDVIVYLAGLTPIKPLRFFTILTIARIPGIIGTSYIGSNIQKENYTSVYVMVAVIAVLLLIGLIFRKKIWDYIKHEEEKDKS